MSFDKRPTSPHFPSGEPGKVPEKIGPYKIEALLEKGGMSLLYLGIHPETFKPTTIKVLLPKFLSRPEVVHRFLNEAEIISMTSHPNIVKLLGHGEWEGGLYIAMEYIQGTSLRQNLLEQPMSLRRALNIIIDIAYALCHLHSHGVIHRDLKPENILIASTGIVKVIDFGIAQLLAEKTSANEPSKHHLIGTPIYISPEQKDNPESVSYPSDIYSLGIIAYELILGKLSQGTIHLSLMPKRMQKILQKCLLPNPLDRYQDIVDFISDVSAFVNSPELEKESRSHDKIIDLTHDLKEVQKSLVPQKPPNWPEIEIGLDYHIGMGTSGVYFDFFDIGGGKRVVVLSESSTSGAEGIIYIATLRGMIRALIQTMQSPSQFAEALNKLLFQDKLAPVFSLKLLLLEPAKNQLRYISCGFGDLWIVKEAPKKCSNQNIALGIDPEYVFTDITLPCNPGDTFFMHTFGLFSDESFEESQFIQLLGENAKNPPSLQVENISRRSLITPSTYSANRTLACLSIQRRMS